MALLAELQDYKSKRICRSYWPVRSYVQFINEEWVDQEGKPTKHSPEKLEGNERDSMWKIWDESMLPPPEPPYLVEVVPVALEPHPNADTLSVVQVKGWTCVVKTDSFKDVKLAAYLQPDAVVPDTLEFRDALGIPVDKVHRDKDFKIRCVKLRGIFSQGLLLPAKEHWKEGDNVAEELKVVKYDPPEINFSRPGGGPCPGMCGDSITEPLDFIHYTKIQNYNNYPNLIEEGEEVVISEKLHGSNCRIGLINDDFMVGSHKTRKRLDGNTVYVKLAKLYDIETKLRLNLPFIANQFQVPENELNIILFGEVFGGNIQHLKYGMLDATMHDLRFFDIAINGRYINYDRFIDLCQLLTLSTVPVLHTGSFHKALIELASGPAFQGDHYREGIVIRPVSERWDSRLGRVILKKVSKEYMLDMKRTDYH